MNMMLSALTQVLEGRIFLPAESGPYTPRADDAAARAEAAAMARLAVRNLDSFLTTGRLLTPVSAPNE